jgi:SAM-dependent methyltransferase
MSQHVYQRRYTCRACCESDLRSVLDLGTQPLANAFLRADQLDEPELRVPLHLMRCPRCGLGQLTHVVDPEVMYGPAYPYRSGYSEGWKRHCSHLADEVGFPEAQSLDIGCLDGVLMSALERRGVFVKGCDPSAPEVPGVYRELFGPATDLGKFDIITAQNVFGHVDDARGFLEGVAANLAPEGTAIIEAPWIVDMLDKGAWDTVYHEHLSYWGLRSLARVAGRAGLAVSRVKHFPHLHGGTMRYYLGHRAAVQTFDSSMCPVWQAEEDLDDHSWQQFASKALNDIQRWAEWFRVRDRYTTVVGYGASAKGNTLLNALPEKPRLDWIADDNPTKHNLHTPGWHIPVLHPSGVEAADEIVCLAPNWAEQIEAKARALGFTGTVRTLWDA